MNLPRGPARQRPGGWAPPFKWRRVWPRPPPPRGGALPGGRLRRGQAPVHAAELMGRPSCCAATLRRALKGITPFSFYFLFPVNFQNLPNIQMNSKLHDSNFLWLHKSCSITWCNMHIIPETFLSQIFIKCLYFISVMNFRKSQRAQS